MCPYLAFDYELAPSRLHNVSSWMQGNRKEIYIYATAVIICKEQFGAEDLKKDKKVANIFATKSRNARDCTSYALWPFEVFLTRSK